MSDKRLTTVRPHGWLYTTDWEGRTTEQETHQCVHCGGHFLLVRGSGKLRGYCARCDGLVCGPGCAECVPTEVLLENIERGRPLGERQIIVPVPVDIKHLK